ncbi:MAG TPA: MBL fold metallo-hydrolase [Anditalea sp.]|nr:MBL fold metallo-hydrolase [Anditalea sp.]
MKRRSFIKGISLAAGVVAIPSTVYSINQTDQYMPVKSATTSNPLLDAVPGMIDYEGTPLDEKGLFINEEYVFWPKMGELIKWKTSKNPYKKEKKNYNKSLDVIKRSSLDEISDNSITWLGHASYLIHLEGKRILIDPILTQPGFFLKRHTELPFCIKDFVDIDYILISHNHRDHCDKESIEILAKLNPEASWLCGLGLDKLLLNAWTGSSKIQAAGWYQQYSIYHPDLTIAYLPTRHWSRRGLSDTNQSLWGAFMIESKGKKIYFGGDSGYGSHLKKVNSLFGSVDYYLAGIGAFAPRWFMSPSHMHPEEVAVSCLDLQAKNVLPMHFGTFDLSDEPLLEPIRLMTQLSDENAFSSKLITSALGEEVKIV